MTNSIWDALVDINLEKGELTSLWTLAEVSEFQKKHAPSGEQFRWKIICSNVFTAYEDEVVAGHHTKKFVGRYTDHIFISILAIDEGSALAKAAQVVRREYYRVEGMEEIGGGA